MSPTGLKNHGNTCYLNSIVQAVSSLNVFQKYLEDILDSVGKIGIKNFESNYEIESNQYNDEFREAILLVGVYKKFYWLVNSY